jgi:hypothetical protein
MCDADSSSDQSLVQVLARNKPKNKAQANFQRLIARIESRRERLQQWQTFMLRHNERIACELLPLQVAMRACQRKMATAWRAWRWRKVRNPLLCARAADASSRSAGVLVRNVDSGRDARRRTDRGAALARSFYGRHHDVLIIDAHDIMRTTLTLDPDVAALLKQAVHTQRRPFKQVLNDALRQALSAPAAISTPFVQQRFAMGRPRIDLTKALALAGELDDQHTMTRYRP